MPSFTYRLSHTFAACILGLLFSFSGKAQKASPVYEAEIMEFRKQYRQQLTLTPGSPLPTAKSQKVLRYYAPDEQYVTLAELVPDTLGEMEKLQVYAGDPKQYLRYGTIYFRLPSYPGRYDSLVVYQPQTILAMGRYKDKLFIPLGDLTNEHDTYGGGRYLEFKVSDVINDRLILDFNKAFNPYCAYHTTQVYTCPLPPEHNRLPIAIPAGERLPAAPAAKGRRSRSVKFPQRNTKV